MTDSKKEWTIMVYMAGDNNLSEDMIRAITELRGRIRSMGGDVQKPEENKNQVNFVIQFDGEHPYVKSRYYKVELKNGGIPRPLPIDDKDDDTGAKKLEAFIRKAINDSPAKNYALILSGHSDAFLERTLLLDENPSGILTLKEIAKVLDKVKSLFRNKKLDIIGFDSCVMHSVEVVYEFKDVAQTCIGSEGSIPNFTWDYKEIGAALINEEACKLTKDRVIEIMRESIKKFNAEYAFGGRSIDFSTIELKGISNFSEELHELYVVLLLAILRLGNLDSKTKELAVSPRLKKLFKILLEAHWNCQTYLHDQFVDIFDFCKRLDNECKDELSEIRISLEDPDLFEDDETRRNSILKIIEFPFWLLLIRYCCLTIKNSQTNIIKDGIFTGSEYQFSNGISMYFPWSFLSLFMTEKKYLRLNLIKKYPAMWITQFLHTVLTARFPAFTENPIPSINLKYDTPNGEIDISTSLPDEASITAFIANYLKEFGKLLSKHDREFERITEAEIFQLFSASSFSKNFGINIDTESIEKYLLFNTKLDPPRSKLDPPRSKGLDSFFYYFGRTNNIFPKLNIEGTFPNGSTTEIDEAR